MKAADVYKRLKGHFGPWAKNQGFSPLKRGTEWSRPSGTEAHIFGLGLGLGLGVARKDYWDRYAGSQFTLDFEIGTTEEDERPKNRGFRYWLLLTDLQREELRQIQNRVITSLTTPPDDYNLVRNTDPETRAWYLAKFVPWLTVSAKSDIWLRYYTPEHVDDWAEYLIRHMPHFLNELEKRS